jgi:transcriptional regulator of acetoin/glycerol metabolism
LRQTLASGRPVVNKAVYILDARGSRLPSSISTAAFKDESGDISPAMQVRLLRVLQERTYEPLGSMESIKTDARIFHC